MQRSQGGIARPTGSHEAASVSRLVAGTTYFIAVIRYLMASQSHGEN